MPEHAARRSPDRRGVVITGLGAVTGLGIGMEPLWDGARLGRSCLRPITRLDASGFACRLAGEVGGKAMGGPAFSARDHVPKAFRKAVKIMARDIELAVVAALRAAADAGVSTRAGAPDPEDDSFVGSYAGERMGCHVGAGLIAAEPDELAAALATCRREGSERLDLTKWGSGGMDALTPLWMLKYLPNMLACHVTILHGCLGPSNTITCAEASGLLSIAESVRVIERNDADLCFAGGAESRVNLMGLLRMTFAGRLAPTGDQTEGERVVRPFDPASAGGLIGEGAGIITVESAQTAAARGARVYARVSGLGAAHSPVRPVILRSDAPPPEDDEGFADAARAAIADARLRPEDIDAVATLGTGVPHLDVPEAGALRRVFGARTESLPLITLGPNIGSCAAGSAALVAAVAARAVHEQRLPARLNAGTPLPWLRAEAAPERPASLGHVLVITSALGGQNAAAILSRAG
ncbi:MAG: hypothetical protein C0468_00770 [Planctomyces sp.]|nr:hypothetical protein [Planctomyces sp.]MBA4119742.1 hypothetical protein [Isosphaera sp.]